MLLLLLLLLDEEKGLHKVKNSSRVLCYVYLIWFLVILIICIVAYEVCVCVHCICMREFYIFFVIQRTPTHYAHYKLPHFDSNAASIFL